MFKGKKTYLIPIISFALIILIGAILLSIPGINNIGMTFKDALYISTSGVTTVGFLKESLVSQFNFMGQLIYAILMEIGALGFVILVSYFWSLTHKRINMSDAILINDSISGDNTGSIKEHSIFIGKFVWKVQLIGAVLLAIRFVPLLGVGQGIWYGIFHSISAFSNTGVDLFGSNGMRVFVNDFYVQIVLIILMVLGSFGVFAIEDIKTNKRFSKFKLQTKIILIGSIIMLVIPSILFTIFEDISLTNGVFLSAARSTGFDIIDISTFSPLSQVLLIIIMFIGGSPASTGSGIKIVTIAVIVATIISTLRGKDDTIIFWRRIPNYTVRMAFTLFTIFAFVIFVGMVAFMNFTELGLNDIMFYTFSAVTNAGFLISDINLLNTEGSIILMILSFVGRIGPLSLVLMFVNKDNKENFVEYPEEKVIL